MRRKVVPVFMPAFQVLFLFSFFMLCMTCVRLFLSGGAFTPRVDRRKEEGKKKERRRKEEGEILLHVCSSVPFVAVKVLS